MWVCVVPDMLILSIAPLFMLPLTWQQLFSQIAYNLSSFYLNNVLWFEHSLPCSFVK